MIATTKTVSLKTSHRTGTLTVTDYQHFLIYTLNWTPEGELGDEDDLCAQMFPHFQPLDDETRPVLLLTHQCPSRN
jgi:hypothetical protein